MRPQDLAWLVALAAMWGASYLFMRYAVPHLGPVLLIELCVPRGDRGAGRMDAGADDGPRCCPSRP